MGTLYVVATPIGNLQDMTPRAIETLRAVRLIAAEDTRRTAILCRHFTIPTRLLSYHQHNQAARRGVILDALAVGDVALVSDAGTPGISDPGSDIVAEAGAAGHRIVPIPGASAVSSAISVSGLVDGPFLTIGFLPRSGEDRRNVLGRASGCGYPLVIFESPPRLRGTLAELIEWGGNRPACIARELTKLHEEIIYGSLADLIETFTGREPRGEFVLVVGAGAALDAGDVHPEGVIRQLLASGVKPSRAAREAAQITGRSGAEMYDLVRAITGKPG